MIGQGTLFEDGGIAYKVIDGWNVYRVGEGLCAHKELPDSYHVLQVSDLDMFPNEEAFVQAIKIPQLKDQYIETETSNGDTISVNIKNMSLSIDGKEQKHPPKMLHSSSSLVSVYGSGIISVYSKTDSTIFDCQEFLD